MATMNKFPPDVPKDWDEARDEVENVTNGLRAKAAEAADKASETVKDSYYRTKEALTEMDPVETAREGGEAVVRAVERHPMVAFGLGALSVGLIAWASMRSPPSRWERHEPDYGRLRRLFEDYGNEAVQAGEGALKSGEKWLRSHGDQARSYAEDGSRLICPSRPARADRGAARHRHRRLCPRLAAEFAQPGRTGCAQARAEALTITAANRAL